MPATLEPRFEQTDFDVSGTWPAQWVGFTRAPEDYEWFSATLVEVRRLAALEPDWDGYDSPTIQSTVMETVVSLLGRFATGIYRPPVPEIAPVTGGGLHLEFGLGNRELEIEVLPDTSVQVVLTHGERELESHGPADRLNVSALVEWLLAEVD